MKTTPSPFSRRDSFRLLALGLSSAAFGARGLFAEDAKPKAPQDTPIELLSLGEKFTLITGAGGNILVLTGKDGGVVIDSGLPDKAMSTSLEVNKVAGRPLIALINTHWHFDHVGGNEALARSGVRIYAHENCLKRVSTTQHNDFMNRDLAPLPPAARPAITFSGEAQMHLNEEDLRLVPVAPAHTDGDIFIHFEKSNVIHMGDIHFNGLYPFIDFSSGGWIGGMIEGSKKALALCDPQTRIIPGHGAIAKQEDLKEYITMLETVYERLVKFKEAGKPIDEVVAAKPSKEFDEKRDPKFLITPDLFVKCSYLGLLQHA